MRRAASILFASLLLTGCTVSSKRHAPAFQSEVIRPSAGASSSHRGNIIISAADLSESQCRSIEKQLQRSYQEGVGASHPHCLVSASAECSQLAANYFQSRADLRELTSKQMHCAHRRIGGNQSGLRELSVHYLESALKAQTDLRVFDAELQGAVQPRGRTYLLQVDSAEYVPDLDLRANKSDSLLRDAGFIASEAGAILTASAATLGPIGALLQSFDVITGIPVSWHNNKKEGLVSVQVSVIDTTTGEVLSSFVTEDGVRRTFSQVGADDMGSGSSRKEDPMPDEALRVLCEKVALRIIGVLKEGGAR